MGTIYVRMPSQLAMHVLAKPSMVMKLKFRWIHVWSSCVSLTRMGGYCTRNTCFFPSMVMSCSSAADPLYFSATWLMSWSNTLTTREDWATECCLRSVTFLSSSRSEVILARRRKTPLWDEDETKQTKTDLVTHQFVETSLWYLRVHVTTCGGVFLTCMMPCPDGAGICT